MPGVIGQTARARSYVPRTGETNTHYGLVDDNVDVRTVGDVPEGDTIHYATLAGRHAGHYAGTVLPHVRNVRQSRATSDAVHEDSGIAVEKDAHVASSVSVR